MEPLAIAGLVALALWMISRTTPKAPPLTTQPPVGTDATPGPAGSGKSAGRTSSTATPPSRVAAPSQSGPVLSAPVMVTKMEPRGWLAAIIVHGGAVMGAMLKYMQTHTHLMPYLMAYADFDKTDGDIVLDHNSDSLLMKITPEAPPPSLPYCGPSFFAPPDTQQEWKWKWTKVLFLGDDYPHFKGMETPIALEPGFETGTDLHLIHSTGEWHLLPCDIKFPPNWLIKSDGTVIDPVMAPLRGNSPEVCPAAAVTAWLGKVMGGGEVWKNRGYEAGLAALSTYKKKALWVPPYYRDKASRRDDWYRRLVRWYHRAAWLVWAGEMLRTHAAWKYGRGVQGWWHSHCAAWGVGVTFAHRTAYQAHALGENFVKATAVHDSYEQIEELLHLIVEHTPVPGSPASLGGQIVPGTTFNGRAMYTRSLLDMPDGTGSIDPPYSVDWWMRAAVDKWRAQQEDKASHSFDVWGAIISVETSLCTYGFGSAFTGVINTAVAAGSSAAVGAMAARVANVALQNCFQMARGASAAQAWQWGDVVGLAGQAVDLIGLDTGDIPKVLPDGLWQSLKTMGSQFPDIPHADMDKLQAPLHAMQSAFDEMRMQGWPYIDEAFGGLGLAQAARDVAGGPKIF